MWKIERTRCQRCQNYQPYEPEAGLREGCTADELYADEDGQKIIPEVNDEITGYMRELGEGCPYFIKNQYLKKREEKRMGKRFEELVKQMQRIATEELQAANRKFPAFSGKHEGFAVLREELDEMIEESNKTAHAVNKLWESVKTNAPLEIAVEEIKQYSLQAAAEAVQVAAMAMKFVSSGVCKDIRELPEMDIRKEENAAGKVAAAEPFK